MWILLSLLCLAGVWVLWQQGSRSQAHRKTAAPVVTSVHSLSTAPQFLIASTNAAKTIAAANTNKFAYRLSNTTKSIDQLLRDDRAILLENALIDTRTPLNFSIPANLRSQTDPGAYIVQARGPIDNAFRAMLAQAGATIVSYIPNNAYLVRISQGSANGLAGNPLTQAVTPYEPYYKISSSMPVTVGQRTVSSAPMKTNRAAGPSLLALAVNQKPLPAGTYLTLGLFSDSPAATVAQIEKLGGQIVAQDKSPFGPIVRVIPPKNWTALAQLSGVQRVEPYHKRVRANDLSRATVGVSTNTTTPANYMGLTGKNVTVEVNDTGIDAQHPDLTAGGAYGRVIGVIGDAPQSLVDTNGHGTHVAGIIAGDGLESPTVTNAPGSTLVGGKGSAGQFRGMAPGATLYSVGGIEGGSDTNVISDYYFQTVSATNNALISNNSWNYTGDETYDLAAASYDAAVRDALPTVTGSQPVLFVFSAGNEGNGDDTTDPGSGTPDSIDSPATAKNVITVGAIQEFRNITNEVTNADGTISAPWQDETSTSSRIAGFSSRGNVGIGTEGTYGRFKPDVVAPGTFVVSTRSEQWDIGTYFYQSPTNYDVQGLSGVVQADSLWARGFPLVPTNTVQVTIQLGSNADSPDPFPPLPIYFGLVSSSTYPYETANGQVSIPSDGGLTIADILRSEYIHGFNYAVSNNTSEPINFDIVLETITTNNPGNYFLVYSNLDQSLGKITGPGPYYRYETGTSMAAADVSGVLALMQDFFTNTLLTTPSPALLKAMLINGASPTSDYYDLQVQNNINFEGWGLVNLPNSLPPGTITNQLNVPCSAFIQDQNPTNALATGDSQTFYVTAANTQPLRITLAWTDPPGDPAAAIKLVNDLNLVVTNYTAGFSNPTNPIVYYGNDIAGGTFNSAGNTNAPNFDSINNIENVYLQQGTGTNFSVTVMGYRVNVNAVTAQTNNFAGVYAPNVVQDYALVISFGNGPVTNAMTVKTNSPIIPGAPSFVSNPTSDQQITYVTATNQPLLNQLVGANTPLMGTNALLLTNSILVSGETNWQVTIGMTNQWHFYVVTNNAVDASGLSKDVTNAAFVTFIPDTLSIPRMGVFADSQANATRPEADIDLYVSTDSSLTNLNPVAISNCVVGTQVGASVGVTFSGASLGRGGTEFVVDTNSAHSRVYYIGVKSEDQMASEYGFIPIFSATPFSQMNNGIQTVNGVPVPVNIPDGSPAHPGYGYVFGIAIYPMAVRSVTVTNQIWHQNFGDLIGTLTLNGGHPDVLNNHDSFDNPPGPYSMIYDDSGQGDIIGSRLSDGPGSLNGFVGQQGLGVWRLTEVDDSRTQTGYVGGYSLIIQPHLANPGTTTPENIAACGWFYDYIDVPPGATNLTITVTNLTTSPKTESLYVKYGDIPTLTSSDEMVVIDTGTPPTNSISIGPPLTVGRYYFGVYVPCTDGTAQSNSITVKIGYVAASQVDYTSAGSAPILDDAVTDNSIFVPNDAIISSVDVGLNVEHPRVSDLVFHLISPDGTRILLVENRGGTTTNGMGETYTNGAPTVTNYFYLVLTENTNLTTTPIKFAPPPFVATNAVATNDVFYLPEQPMDSLAGQNAYGTWTLEIQDDRAGANLTNWLTSWQLRFTFTTPEPTILNTNSAFANSIPSNGIAYYLIKVPDSATAATNILISPGGPLNVWYNLTTLPIGANPDFPLMSGVRSDSVTLDVGTTPPLPSGPSRFYYLGVQNLNIFAVNYHLDVDFDDATMTWSAFSISSAVMTSSGARFQWNAPMDARFQLEWTTNISPPIVWTTNANIITSSNGTFTFTDSSSTNSHARFYRLLQVP
jgi:subtilisin-like proprotein convertase family protein